MRIIFATGNAGKMREIRDILEGTGAEILSLKDLGLVSKAEENGASFAENARIKAMEIYGLLKPDELSGTVVMADDSGLCIDFLGGEPGVRSARFMGHDTSYVKKNAAILDLLKEAPENERGARFVCHICAVTGDGSCYDAEGSMHGVIAREARGGGGFGYDPIFYLPELGCTSGELSEEAKNAVSHRGKALRAMKAILEGKGVI